MGIQQTYLEGILVTPVISLFTAYVSTPLCTGSTITLYYTFTGGTGAIDNGIGAVTSGGSITTGALTTSTCNTDYTYTLTVTSPSSVVTTATVTVSIVPIPTITSFTTNHVYVTNGSTAVITPTFPCGTGSIDNGVGAVTSGTGYTVTPPNNATTVYTLTVTTNGTCSNSTQTVSVTAVAAPSITSFTRDNATLTNGQSTYLRPTFTGGTGSISPTVGAVSSGGAYSITPPNSTTTTYTLTVTNLAGSTATATVSITTYAAPSISSFTTDSSCILNGNSTTLRYTFSNGTGSISPTVGSVSSGGNSGITPASSTTTTYTLTVTNGAGSTSTATVNVQAVATPSASMTRDNQYVTNGGTTVLRPTFSNGTGSINNGVGSVSSGGAYTITPPSNATTTYTLTVTNCATSTTASVTVQAVPAPVATSLTPSQTYFDSNHLSITLTPVFSNASSATIYNGGTLVTNTPTTGVGVGTTAVNGSTNYWTLTAYNLAGASATASGSSIYEVLPTASLSAYQNGAPTKYYVDSAHSIVAMVPTFTGATLHSQLTATTDGLINAGPLTSGSTYTWTSNVSQSYQLHTYNNAGSSAVSTAGTGTGLIISVSLPSISSFIATAGGIGSPLTYNTGTTITPTFSNGTGSISPSIGAVTSGTGYSTGNLTANTTYTLTVTNLAGSTTTSTVTVYVLPNSGSNSYTRDSNGAYVDWTAPGTGGYTYYVHLSMQAAGEDGEAGGSSYGRGGGGGQAIIGAHVQVTAGTTYTFRMGLHSTYGAAAGNSSMEIQYNSPFLSVAGSPGTSVGGGGTTGGTVNGSNGGTSSSYGGTIYNGGGGGGAKYKAPGGGSATGYTGGTAGSSSGGAAATVTTIIGYAATAGGGGGASYTGNGGAAGSGNSNTGTSTNGAAGTSDGAGGGGGGSETFNGSIGSGGAGKSGSVSFSWPYAS